MRKVIGKFILIFFILALTSCNKDDGITFSYSYKGNWEVVKYKVNGVDVIDNQDFFSKKFIFFKHNKDDYQRLKPVNCSKCANSYEYMMTFGYNENTKNSTCSIDFGKNSILDTNLYKFQIESSVFNYKVQDTINPNLTFWQKKYLSRRIWKIDNLHYNKRLEDIEITFEKY